MAKQVDVSNKTDYPKAKSNFFSTQSNNNWAYGAGAVLILLIVFLLGAGFARHHRAEFNRQAGMIDSPQQRGLMRMHERGFNIGGTGVNGQTRSQGVVTSVNGSNFTIAGQGSTTNVTTNSSTKYQNGDSVKQNDTVIVFGTISNNTLTATQIVINP